MAYFLQIHPDDNVAVALKPAPKGTAFQGVTASEDIPQGHKMALLDIQDQEQVVKYGLSIDVVYYMPGFRICQGVI